MPPRLDLRFATTADRAFVVEMARHACVIEDWPLPEPESEDVHALLPRSEDVAVIGTDPGAAIDVGAVWTFHHDPPLVVGDGDAHPEIAIAVAHDRRGHGIGSALLDAMIRRCTGTDPALILNVHQRNPARRLYERAGFHVVGQGRGALGLAMLIRLDPGARQAHRFDTGPVREMGDREVGVTSS